MCKYLLDLDLTLMNVWRDNYCLENDYDSKTKLGIIFSMLHFFETKIIKRKSLTCLRDWAVRVLKSLMGFSNTSNNRQKVQKMPKMIKISCRQAYPSKKKLINFSTTNIFCSTPNIYNSDFNSKLKLSLHFSSAI